jgi:flagellar basal-body rod protein FlgG
MYAQQMNVDTISNNLANVNTAGYKKERLEFKTLLYQTMLRADLDPANQTGRPVNLQVGLGVRPIATSRLFDQGNFQITNNTLDVALSGAGFFTIATGADAVAYTKDGTFKLSLADGGLMLVTSEGYPVLNTDGAEIIIPENVDVKTVSIDESGVFTYTNADGQPENLGSQFAVVQFSNPQGLESVGRNLFEVTPASGEPLSEADGETNTLTQVVQGTLEMSNVAVADEMVNLIVAQRAYDLNSKVVTTSDEMLQTAAGLKR